MRNGVMGLALGVGLTLAVGGAYVGYQSLSATPAEQMCGHLIEVCEPDGDPAEAVAECVTSMQDWTEDVAAEDVDRLSTCVLEADGCAEASGCLVGHGLRESFSGVADFFQGMGNALGFGR